MEFIIVALILLLAYREWSHLQGEKAAIKDRSKLLQRIQAPTETATAVALEEMPEGAIAMPRYTDAEDWEAYNVFIQQDDSVLN